MDQARPLLLLSGLSLERKSSFYRQLNSLAAIWRTQGRSVLIAGPVLPPLESRKKPSGWSAAPQVRWQLEGGSGVPLYLEDLIARSSAKAVIALGYPDQFTFLQRPGLPCFLWSQFSRLPGRALPRPPTYIPLTAKTAEHLGSASCSRIGPIIPHGVDSHLFVPRSERRDGSDLFVLGTVANNSRRKRLDLIVRSFTAFAREHRGSQLLIKTNRPVSLDGVDLPALIDGEHLGQRIEIITAELEDPAMVELYNRMDLYLNLSEWEGFCIPVIEAMSCGVPVVSPPIQGPGEILPYPDTVVPGGLVHEEDGTVLYQADPKAVAGLLGALAGDGSLRRRLSRKGREAVLSRYDIRRIAAQWDGVLQRI